MRIINICGVNKDTDVSVNYRSILCNELEARALFIRKINVYIGNKLLYP